jgi:hypothetical protein
MIETGLDVAPKHFSIDSSFIAIIDHDDMMAAQSMDSFAKVRGTS